MSSQKNKIKIEWKNNKEILLTNDDWTLTVDVMGNNPQLIPGPRGMCRIVEISGHTLLLTAGEHHKASQEMNHQVHMISKNGELEWSFHWQVIEPIKMYNGNFVILSYCNPYPAYKNPMLEVNIVGVDGTIKEKFDIGPPENLRELYKNKNLSSIYAKWDEDSVVITPLFRLDSGIDWKKGIFTWNLPFKTA